MARRIEMKLAIVFHHLLFPITDPPNLFFLRKASVEKLFRLIRHYVSVEKAHPEEIARVIVKMWKVKDAIITAALRGILFAIAENGPTGEPCEPREECHQKGFTGAIVGDVFEDANHPSFTANVKTNHKTNPIATNAKIDCQMIGIVKTIRLKNRPFGSDQSRIAIFAHFGHIA
jgi:hypothetical protein